MNDKKTNIDVFIAYARKDVHFLDQLRIYLKPLHRSETIKIWYDGEIVPGTVWEKHIKTNLHNADIILCLVSAYSLASDYFYDKELADAMERHHREEAIVIPVILSDCTWELTDLKHLQALPRDGKPLKSWDDESSAYTNIVRGLYKSIEEVKNRRNNRAKAIELAEARKQEEERKLKEQEERSKAKQEAKRQEEERKIKEKADEEKRLKEEALTKRKAEEEQRLKEEAEAKQKAEEDQRLKEIEAKRMADEEQRLKEEEKAIRKAEEEQRLIEEKARRKAEEEQAEREKDLWKKACAKNTITSYKNYLKETDSRVYSKEAELRIKELRREATLKREKNRLEREREVKKLEEKLWQKTIMVNTKEAYQDYLNNSKLLMYKVDAKRKMSLLEEKEIDLEQKLKAKEKTTETKEKHELSETPALGPTHVKTSHKKKHFPVWSYVAAGGIILLLLIVWSPWKSNDAHFSLSIHFIH